MILATHYHMYSQIMCVQFLAIVMHIIDHKQFERPAKQFDIKRYNYYY